MKNLRWLSFIERLGSHLKSVKNLSLLLASVTAFGLLSCQNLDDVNNRLDQVDIEISTLKSAVKALQDAYNQGKIISSVTPLSEKGAEGWAINFSDGTSIRVISPDNINANKLISSVVQDVDKEEITLLLVDGSSFTFNMLHISPKLISMDFRAADNPSDLIEDVSGNIIGDSIVEFWVRYVMDSKKLIPQIKFEGDYAALNDSKISSDMTPIDFKKPVKLTIQLGDKSKAYNVYVHAFTGLPVMWIETEGRTSISSKEEYVNAHFKLVEDVKTRAAGDVFEADGQIKGRGNSTWGLPKKPYAIKFGNKESLLNEPKDKSWVLLANYTDKTSLRNSTAFYLGKISNLDYTPRFHFVDVMLNGRYNGTYQLGEKLKISKDRLNVGDDGFLMEIDVRALGESDGRYFYVDHISVPINIKDPDVDFDDENFTYAKDYVSLADAALFSDNFKDPEQGWQKYMDLDSFVDWYLINEIAKNNDAIYWTSCYMNLKRGKKLKMGPLWDFDIAFGNVDYNGNYEIEGFWIKNVEWYSRLFQDPVFVNRVKERFNYFYSKMPEILDEVNQNAQYIRYSVIENNNKWGTFYNYTWPNYDIWGNYHNEVQSMKSWIKNRFEWLKLQFDTM